MRCRAETDSVMDEKSYYDDFYQSSLRKRRIIQEFKDFITFPFRGLLLFEEDRFGLSSLRSERFYYVARGVVGFCLDVGCGRRNRFIKEYIGNGGIGIDVYPYEGLTKENVIDDPSHFPFEDESFDSVTFIASINHIPRFLRDAELAEAFRCLRPGGNVIITMGNPIAEFLIHKWVHSYDKLFGTHHDVDSERGMQEGENYHLRDGEIRDRLIRARFTKITKKYFWTQWWLNHLFIGWKKSEC